MLNKVRKVFNAFYNFAMNHTPCKIGRVIITLALVPVCVLVWMIYGVIYGGCELIKALIFDTAEMCQDAWNWKVKK